MSIQSNNIIDNYSEAAMDKARSAWFTGIIIFIAVLQLRLHARRAMAMEAVSVARKANRSCML